MLTDTALTYETLDKIPKREHFINKHIHSIIENKLAKKEPVLFLPTYIKDANFQPREYSKATYHVIAHGILESGYRIAVCIDNIEPYFEVLLSEGKDEPYEEEVKQILEELNKNPMTKPNRSEVIKAKPFKYFQEHRSSFLRLYYSKNKNRIESIKAARLHGRNTYSDELNSVAYHRIACRDALANFSGWSMLSNYEQLRKTNLKEDIVLLVSIKNYTPHAVDSERDKHLIQDKTVSLCWDIETWSPEGDVPKPENPEDKMFCIGMSFQFIHEKTPFLKVVLTTQHSTPDPDFYTVKCKGEVELIKSFAKIFEKISPEYVMGFNDSDYDWNWFVKRAKKTPNLLSFVAKYMSSSKFYTPATDENVEKYNFVKETVKLEADMSVDGYTLSFDGYICVDVRTVYRRMFPLAEKQSLSYFLSMMKLNSKEDMPYRKMFEIYKRSRDKPEAIETYADDMRDVNKYCLVDAIRCHELMAKRNVILDSREVAASAYCAVYDAFYRAGGMKVRNLTIAVGQRPPFNMRFCSIVKGAKSEYKYPGAYVFPPQKGLKISKLSIDERIQKAQAQLATSNSETHLQKYRYLEPWVNVPEEKVAEYKELVKQYGCRLQDFPATVRLDSRMQEFLAEPMGRPITGLDFSSLYPSLIRTYNFSPEYCILDKKYAKEYAERTGNKITRVKFMFGPNEINGWFVWHNNKTDKDDPEFQFGIYPYILDQLFNQRKQVKKIEEKYKHIKEAMDKQDAEDTKAGKQITHIAEHKDEYEYNSFMLGYLNAKQVAKKLLMNTFYGEAGNQISPFFVIQIAGGITSYGQINIKMAKSFVESRGCTVYYGDTDSLYLSVPEADFTELDRAYYSGAMSKLDYWTKMVETTFNSINSIRDGVNSMFESDNGTRYLSMAYEEVLFPVAFTAKKKYYGIAHENITNFNPKSLFIRGLEVKKRGVSGLLRDIFNEIMWDSVAINNLYSLIELVEQKIDNIYSRQWSLKDFIQTDVWKPKKNNVKVQTFVKRMRERGIEITPYERFNYVIVQCYPWKYDYRGRKSELSIGDKMELVEEAERLGLKVDLDNYMTGSVNGQLARLIVYSELFHVEPTSHSEDDLKIAEDRIYKNACRYIEDYCKKYYAKYNSIGAVCKKLYKKADSYIASSIVSRDELAYSLMSYNTKIDIPEQRDNSKEKALVVGAAERKTFVDEFTSCIEKQAKKAAKDFGKKWIMEYLRGFPKEERKKEASKLQQHYGTNLDEKTARQVKNIYTDRLAAFEETRNILENRLVVILPQVMELYAAYQSNISMLTDMIKQNINFEPAMAKTEDPKDYDESIEPAIAPIDEELSAKAAEFADSILENTRHKETLKSLKDIYCNMLSNYIFIHRTKDIVSELKRNKDVSMHIADAPADFDMNKQIEADLADTVAEMDDLVL